MSTAIDAAVMSKLQGDATLTGLAPGGVYPDVAPEDTPDPFVIVTLQAHEDVHELTRLSAFEVPRYLVKAVGLGTDAADAVAAYARIHALLQGQTLTISGFTWMDTARESRVKYVERDGPVYWQHVGGIYRVEACPA
jgi:Protein of unknown function (DUF3168)